MITMPKKHGINKGNTMSSENWKQWRKKFTWRHLSTPLFGAALVGAITAVYFTPNSGAAPCGGSDCIGKADCTGPCLQVNTGFPIGWTCADAVKAPKAGRVCKSVSNKKKTCEDNQSVICAMSGYMRCPGPPALPDCRGIKHNQETRGAGCGQ